MTAANDLGLTDAVPAKVVVHTDARRRAIKLGNVTITFRPTAASKLFWAGDRRCASSKRFTGCAISWPVKGRAIRSSVSSASFSKIQRRGRSSKPISLPV